MPLFPTKLLLIVVTMLHSFHFIYANKTTVLCYMVAWASSRPNEGKFKIKDADTQHCTHIVYAFMGLNGTTSTIHSIDPKFDHEMGGQGEGQLKQLKELKTFNQNLKVLASIGGYNQGSVNFSEMARSTTKRGDFINSIVKFIRDYKLDGIDICWQHPGYKGGRAEDRRNFISLLKELKAVFQPVGWLVTVHILAKSHLILLGYDVKSISEVADFINLAAVEYHGPWDRTTGIMAPLKSATSENNVEYNVDYVLKKGAIPSKVLLGLPTYGHAYVVSDEIKKGQYLGLNSEITFASQWTNEGGVIAYSEICYNIKTDSSWKMEWDQASDTPVAYNDKRFVSYDNKKSLIEKAKLVKTHKLGGIMLWSLDMDDFRGLCHGKKYPLLSAVTEFLNEDNSTEFLDEDNSTEFLGEDKSSNNNITILNFSDQVKPSENKAVNQEYSNYKFCIVAYVILHFFIIPSLGEI